MTKSRTTKFNRFDDFATMLAALTDKIVHRLSEAIASRGHATLVVSGGNTPGDLFDMLSRQALPWHRVSITLSDERWVSVASEASNERLVRSRLLTYEARPARFVSLKTEQETARDAEHEVNVLISQMPRPFDVVLLGIGIDGHTASLIPKSSGLIQALDLSNPALVRHIIPPEATKMGERMTLTLRGILDSRLVILMMRGEAKLAAYERAAGASDLSEAPVRGIINQDRTPFTAYWGP